MLSPRLQCHISGYESSHTLKKDDSVAHREGKKKKHAMRVHGLNPAKNLHVEWCAPHTCCRLVNRIAIHHFSSCDDVMKSIYQSSPPGEPCTLYSSRLVPVIPFSPLLVSRVFELEEKLSRKAKQK